MSQNNFDQNEIGRRLKMLRNEKSLTISALADTLGMSRSLLSKIEKGERNLSVDALVKCSKIFGISTDSLLGLEEYDLVLYEESYFSTYTLEETKENIVKRYIKDSQNQAKLVNDYVHNMHGLKIPKEFELEAMEVVMNKENFKNTKNPKHMIAYILFLIKNYYLDDKEFFAAAGIIMTDEDFELLRIQLGILFIDEKKYFKKTVYDFIKNAPDLNRIYKLVNELDAVSRKHLENFLDSTKRNVKEVK